MTTINFRGQLLDLTLPQVVGILNVTPDSFYTASRTEDVDAVRRRADAILAEGAAMIDVGACSTRPGSTAVSEDEEMRRLAMALEAIRRDHPEAIVSIDTFRSRVARRCIEDFGPAIINDISGGESDESMFQVVADLAVPYILTHNLPSSSPSSSSS
ncbi:MAG: dihydropteroate synthase, partial [Bacteroidaceae bacterium]|nr:dihydropteroate synthase [Bacteroidaceae bacterium]